MVGAERLELSTSLLKRQVLCRLSYAPMVGIEGLEPSDLRLSTACLCQFGYTPIESLNIPEVALAIHATDSHNLFVGFKHPRIHLHYIGYFITSFNALKQSQWSVVCQFTTYVYFYSITRFVNKRLTVVMEMAMNI